MKTNYAEKLEARKEKYEELQRKAKEKSNLLYKESSSVLDGIPFGQPILVGHHSEGKHRNLINKSWDKMGKSVKEGEKAEYYESRINSMNNSKIISSDNPDAIRLLEEKLNNKITTHEKMKKTNKEAKKKKLQIPYEKWQLSNSNQNINTIKKRIAILKAIEYIEDKEKITEYNDIKILESVSKNRVQILFSGKPSLETRLKLKQNGFRWSPREMAWQAFLKPWNIRTAHKVIKEMN